MTPHRIAKFYTHTCWRDCGLPGTLIHIFWSCPHIRQLWTDIERTLQEILHLPIALSPHLAILNLTIEDIPPNLRLVTTHVLLATRLLIARKWKTKDTPTLIEVIALVQSHFTYETILSRGKPTFTKMINLWNPWILWYTNTHDK